MNNLYFLAAVLILLSAGQTFAQTKDSLRQRIEQIISARKATVGVSVVGNDRNDRITGPEINIRYRT